MNNEVQETEDIGQLVFHKNGIYITPVYYNMYWIKFDSYGKRIGLFDENIEEKISK